MEIWRSMIRCKLTIFSIVKNGGLTYNDYGARFAMCGTETLQIQARFAMCGTETLQKAFVSAEAFLVGVQMIERGIYFANGELAKFVRENGGTWNATKERPIVCLVKSYENDSLYWAIPMGNYDHRNAEQHQRLDRYLNLPERDIRSCFYHIGRTTDKSIFFISDAIPVTDAFIERAYTGYDGKPFVIQNQKLIAELERKLFRILAFENAHPNYYRQHITDIKKAMIGESEAK